MKFLPVKKKPRTLTHPQQLKQNHNNMTGTTRWPHFSPCNPTNPFIFSPADSVFKDDNSQLSSARTFNSSHTATDCRYDSSDSSQAWSMKSLLAILPDSPSPVCSSCPSPSTPSSFFPSSDAFSSRMSTELSTQRNKSSCIVSNISKRSASLVEIDEWMKHANGFFQPNLQKHQPRGMENENSSMKLLPICEERTLGDSIYVGHVDSCSPITGDIRMLTRPKPYHAFLDEIKKQEAEAQVDASRKAAQMKFMKKLKGKEAAIREWESRKTKIATTQMKKIEDKLENRRTKALEKMQKKISKAQKKANKKKVKERQSIFKKISRAIEAAEIEATKKSTKCLSLTRIC
ncbi:uncharacterized protein LOC117932275 [Vitis riparia]|uniref:uncharacterized protein LOC117932275 n=1 Tax=Vitis riparia TaxID=96939 RepID=UPI00155AC7A4|nr:uncharacterized protein LOC117932275 [Vitis riparia]